MMAIHYLVPEFDINLCDPDHTWLDIAVTYVILLLIQ